MQKFFVKNEQIKDDTVEILGEDTKHIVSVLRLKKGNKIIICNKGLKVSYEAEIVNISNDKVECKILSKINETTESNVNVTIFQGLPKADKMEYIIQKATELGVKEIYPVAMQRSIVKIASKDKAKKINRWQKIAESASKQSGRDIIPTVQNIIRINELVSLIKNYDIFLVAYEKEKSKDLKSVLKKVDIKKDGKNLKIGVLIGPEGGISEEEIEILSRENIEIVTLGNRILRTETASLVILSNIMYEYEM